MPPWPSFLESSYGPRRRPLRSAMWPYLRPDHRSYEPPDRVSPTHPYGADGRRRMGMLVMLRSPGADTRCPMSEPVAPSAIRMPFFKNPVNLRAPSSGPMSHHEQRGCRPADPGPGDLPVLDGDCWCREEPTASRAPGNVMRHTSPRTSRHVPYGERA